MIFFSLLLFLLSILFRFRYHHPSLCSRNHINVCSTSTALFYFIAFMHLVDICFVWVSMWPMSVGTDKKLWISKSVVVLLLFWWWLEASRFIQLIHWCIQFLLYNFLSEFCCLFADIIVCCSCRNDLVFNQQHMGPLNKKKRK